MPIPLNDRSDIALRVLLRHSNGRSEALEVLNLIQDATDADACVLFIDDPALADIYPINSKGDKAFKIQDQMELLKQSLQNTSVTEDLQILSEMFEYSVHSFDDYTFIFLYVEGQRYGALGLFTQDKIPVRDILSLVHNAAQLLLCIKTSRSHQNLKSKSADHDRTRFRLEKAFSQNLSDKALVENLVLDLRAAVSQAESASQAKSDFLSRVSHELRTPMNAILGFTQLMGNLDLSSKHQDYVNHVLHAGTHLLSLINKILDLSAIESGVLELNYESIEIQTLIRECLDLMGPLADMRHISLVDSVSKKSPIILLTDNLRLKQVVINLLSNAIKYNRHNGTVTIDCTVLHDGIELTIDDTGPGIPDDKLGQLFLPFSRLMIDETFVGGTGLGLVICKQTIEFMGGTVAVESTVGIGSTFYIRLPFS